MEKPIRLGLIGCGRIVRRTHAPGYLANPGTMRVVALADPVEENRAWGGKAFGLPRGQRYSEYPEMLAKAELDAVVIATPHAFHAEQAIQATKAGVAVISEKPMAMSLEEADAVLDAVEQAGVPYGVVHNCLFSLSMRAAEDQLKDMPEPFLGRTGGLGLKSEDFSASHSNPAVAWRASKAAGGGCIIDTAYHEIYCLQTLMGSPVRYVEGRVKTLRLNVDVDDVALLLCEHENGAVSTVSRSWCAPGFDNGSWCEVHTSEGSIWVDNRSSAPDALKRSDREGTWRQSDIPGPPEPGEDVNDHGLYFAATFQALADGSDPPVTGRDGRHNLAIIEAARKATEERKAIDLWDLKRV